MDVYLLGQSTRVIQLYPELQGAGYGNIPLKESQPGVETKEPISSFQTSPGDQADGDVAGIRMLLEGTDTGEQHGKEIPGEQGRSHPHRNPLCCCCSHGPHECGPLPLPPPVLLFPPCSTQALLPQLL